MSAEEADLERGLQRIFKFVGIVLLIMFFLGVYIGTPLIAGAWTAITGQPFVGGARAALWGVIALTLLYIGYASDSSLGVAFGLVTLAILLLAAPVLPDVLTRPFAIVTEALGGIQFLGPNGVINPQSFAVLTLAAVFIGWSLEVFLFGRPKKPGAVVNRVTTNAEQLVRQYAKISRLLLLLGIVSVFTVSEAGFRLLGDAGALFADIPVISGYIATLVGGFGTFVADWPVLGSLSAVQFGVFAIIIAALAIAVKYQ